MIHVVCPYCRALVPIESPWDATETGIVCTSCDGLADLSRIAGEWRLTCTTCWGSGAADSGGFTPSGEPFSLPCPDCARREQP